MRERGRRSDGSCDHEACRVAPEEVRAPSPGMRALEEIYRSRVRQQLRRPRALLRLLCGSGHVRLRPLRRGKVRVAVERGVVPDCARCAKVCCRSPHLVSLRLPEVGLLHDLGLGWALRRLNPATRRPVYEEHPALREAERRDTVRRFPVLAQTIEGACIFLDANGACAIYPARPLACRSFPYRLSRDLRRIAYAPGCPHPRTGGSPEEVGRLVEATLQTFDEKVRDLLLLELAPDEVARLELAEHLPTPPAGSRSFRATLERLRREEEAGTSI